MGLEHTNMQELGSGHNTTISNSKKEFIMTRKRLKKKEAKMAKQRIGKNEQLFINDILRPKIIFSKDAWEDIQTILSLNPTTEVTFHGEVFIQTGNIYYIEQIYVFRQFVSAVHVNLALEGNGTMAEYIEKVATGAKVEGYEWDLNIDKCFAFPTNFSFHGHLHPGTLLEHSSVDINGYLTARDIAPYFIDAIFTRDGKFRFWFYGLCGFVDIPNCPIEIETDSRISTSERRIRNETIARMISERVIPANSQGGFHGNQI